MESKESEQSCEEYILRVQSTLLDAHIEPQHFAEALDIVASRVSAEAAFLWMSRRNSELKCWYLTSKSHPFFEDMDLRIKYPEIYHSLEKNKSIAAQGPEFLMQMFPSDGIQIVSCGISTMMLYPVYWSNGNMAFVIGALNCRNCHGSLSALQCTALSFLMAMDHYDNYHILNKMGKIDIMTGLLNRNSYQIALASLKKDRPECVGCIYIDINGLHEINNYLGHSAGDDMLRTVSKAILRHFTDKESFRIGGDEFVILCQNRDSQFLHDNVKMIREELLKFNYEISTGISWCNGQYQIDDIIDEAENNMRIDKQNYYNNGGSIRNLNQINKQTEKLLNEKRDADMFLSVLRPEFKGVYFVDLDTDTVRHIFIPDYFEEILNEVGDIFSDALLEYARRYVREEFISKFEPVCNYELLRKRLNRNELPGFMYQKKNGEFLQLNIVKLKSDSERKYRTLWTFSDPDVIKI